MIELVTDLVGKTIEFRRYDDYSTPQGNYPSVRGRVRGAYVAANQPHLIIEAAAGLMAEGDSHLVTFALCDGRTRVVADSVGEVPPKVPGEFVRAAGLIHDFIELGPRPDRQYCEPTDEDQAIWDAWDSRFAALIGRARALGIVVEPVAKE